MTNPFTKPTRGSSEEARRQCIAYWGMQTPMGMQLVCWRCGIIFNPATRRWVAEHKTPLAHGGKDEPPNIAPSCEPCAWEKTAVEDVPRIAKGKRQRDRHF